LANRTTSGPTEDRPPASPQHPRPAPPPSALKSTAAFKAWLGSLPPPPASYVVGQELNWDAPWCDVVLRVELPFWLMLDDTRIEVDVADHVFSVAIESRLFELHIAWISDAKSTTVYQGPLRKPHELSPDIQEAFQKHPAASLWRKCKTILKITSRCNEDVWNKRNEDNRPPSVEFYLQELCRAHLLVVNKVIQAYRLACYDYFAFEVAPWDVPRWLIEREGQSYSCLLVSYRGWDQKPKDLDGHVFKLIEPDQLKAQMTDEASPGELELLDAINLMERGNYSDAVRRVTTAVEVIVEAVASKQVELKEGATEAAKFVKNTRMNFPGRIKKYEQLTGRELPSGLKGELEQTRTLRHRIVHGGYRISPGERGAAQRAVDTGRWTFNWFENDEKRRKARETKVAFRSLGRDMLYGIFRSEITPSGVTVSRAVPPSLAAETSNDPQKE
jgi:hypothetical protein